MKAESPNPERTMLVVVVLYGYKCESKYIMVKKNALHDPGNSLLLH